MRTPIVFTTNDVRVRRPLPGGFTLIELMIALTLMFVGLLGLVSLEVLSQRAGVDARLMTEAVALAQDRLEKLEHTPIAQIAALTETSLEPGGSSGSGPFTRTTTVAPSGSGAAITVVVAWQDFQGRPHGVTMSTLREP